jgi:hypothetical protein
MSSIGKRFRAASVQNPLALNRPVRKQPVVSPIRRRRRRIAKDLLQPPLKCGSMCRLPIVVDDVVGLSHACELAETGAERELLDRPHVDVRIDLIGEVDDLVQEHAVGLADSDHARIEHPRILRQAPASLIAHAQVVMVEKVRQLAGVAVMKMTFLDMEQRTPGTKPAKQPARILDEIRIGIAQHHAAAELLERLPDDEHLPAIVHAAWAGPLGKLRPVDGFELNGKIVENTRGIGVHDNPKLRPVRTGRMQRGEHGKHQLVDVRARTVGEIDERIVDSIPHRGCGATAPCDQRWCDVVIAASGRSVGDSSVQIDGAK